MLKESFEILVVTYNRKAYLEHTLQQLLAADSPVKEVSITILDNCSTDGTSELIDAFCTKYPNLKHIRHVRNIGGNANIARAFELAQKEYFWVLADDDDYDFTHWDEVEKEMKKKAGLIVVNREYLPKEQKNFQPWDFLRFLTFMPAAIHRRDTLQEQDIIHIHYTVPLWFPHLAACIAAINKRLPFCVVSDNIVLTGKNEHHNGVEYHRRTPGVAEPYKFSFFELNYIRVLALLEDKKLRSKAVDNFHWQKQSFFKSALIALCKENHRRYENRLSNYLLPLPVFSTWQKIQFIAAAIYLNILAFLLYPHFRKKRKEFEKKVEETVKNSSKISYT